MFTWIIVILILCLLLACFGYNIPDRFRYRKLPGAYEEFLWGSMTSFRKIGSYNFYFEYQKKYGDTFVIWFGRIPRLYTSDPDVMKKIGSLSNRPFLPKPTPIEVKENPAHSDILLAKKERWQDVRAISQPAFNPNAINEYLPCIVRSAEGCIADIDKAYKDGKLVDIIQLSKYLTTSAIMESAFGIKLDLQKEDERATLQHLSQLTRSVLSEPDRVPMRRYIFNFFNLFPEVIQFIRFLKIPLHRFLRPGIGGGAIGEYVYQYYKDQDLLLDNNHQDNQDSNAVQSNGQLKQDVSPLTNFKNWKEHEGPGFYVKLIQKGLVQGHPLDQKQIEYNFQTMVIAGHDTTATTIGMTVYLLAQNKEVEHKVIQEVDRNGSQKTLTVKDIEKYPFVEAVVKESLRLYPPAIFATRQVDSDNFSINGQKLPRDFIMFSNIRGLHLNEKHWPRAREYIPERFLPGSEFSQKHPGAFLPFGYGPRICLGWRFAMMEATIALIMMYQKYSFTVPPQQQGKTIDFGVQVTIVPKTPVEVVPRPRMVE